MNDAEHWRRVDRLFEAALDRPSGERPALLDDACAGDPALRHEVERLLAADAQSARFLERPAAEVIGLTGPEQVEGQRLGPYRLLRAIGRGGMGTVFVAMRADDEYERLVAVKVLRSGLESTELRHRFLAERQILARLDHPGIARLYDGGSTDDGRPYLVMELVEGLPVDEYCDRHRLSVDRRLALFLRICAAVQYAHQNLLVHRDIKPGNVLVTAQEEPKLLDFGIAKQLDGSTGPAARTRTGLRVMTPSYASPEQAKGGAITTASDVYSLGVLLYELLCGRSPYQVEASAPQYELERAIGEQEPEKASAAAGRSERSGRPGDPAPEELAAARGVPPAALRRRLAGDLDTILAVALRKEPARRYGSVAALAADLERHLRDLPVAARPDTLRYRTRKFVRRHRAAVSAGVAVVLLVAALAAILFQQGRQTLHQRDKARYALSFLVDTFKQADPYETQGDALTAREILDRGADRVSRELSGEPDVQAAMMDAIGEVNLGLGRYDAAEPLLVRALGIRRATFGADSLETAESLEHLAELRAERSDHAAAEAHLRQALAIRRRQGDDDVAVARTLNRLGRTLLARGVGAEGWSDVEALHQEALAIARRTGPPGPAVTETLFALADLQRAQGRYAPAEDLYRQGLAIERQTLGERDPRYWRDRSRLADAMAEGGKLTAAEAILRDCLRVQRELLGREHPDAASTLNSLAVAIHLQGKAARAGESTALQREALELTRSHFGPRHWRVADALLNLAASLTGEHRNDEALPLYQEALEIRRRTLGESHWQVAQVLLLLAEAGGDKDPEKALALAGQARDVFAAAMGPDHPYVAHALREMGRIHLKQNRFADAEPFLRRCLEIRRATLEPRHPDLAHAQYLLGKCLVGQGRAHEAEAPLRAALATYSALYGPQSSASRRTAELLAGGPAGARQTVPR